MLCTLSEPVGVLQISSLRIPLWYKEKVWWDLLRGTLVMALHTFKYFKWMSSKNTILLWRGHLDIFLFFISYPVHLSLLLVFAFYFWNLPISLPLLSYHSPWLSFFPFWPLHLRDLSSLTRDGTTGPSRESLWLSSLTWIASVASWLVYLPPFRFLPSHNPTVWYLTVSPSSWSSPSVASWYPGAKDAAPEAILTNPRTWTPSLCSLILPCSLCPVLPRRPSWRPFTIHALLTGLFPLSSPNAPSTPHLSAGVTSSRKLSLTKLASCIFMFTLCGYRLICISSVRI